MVGILAIEGGGKEKAAILVERQGKGFLYLLFWPDTAKNLPDLARRFWTEIESDMQYPCASQHSQRRRIFRQIQGNVRSREYAMFPGNARSGTINAQAFPYTATSPVALEHSRLLCFHLAVLTPFTETD